MSQKQNAFSLAECLIIMAVLSLLLPGLLAALTQSTLLQKQVERNLTLEFLTLNQQGRLNIPTNTFSTEDNGSTIQTFTQNGQSMGWLNKVDNTNSTIFNRSMLTYLYDDSSKALTQWKDATRTEVTTDSFYYDVGSSTALLTDALGNVWYGDASYSATTKTGGYTTSGGAVGSDVISPITNTSLDTVLYTFREGSTLSYSFPVGNGKYVVDFLLAELDETVTSSSPNRRRVDVTLEGSTVGTDISAFESMGAHNKAFIASYSTTVADGVLDVTVVNAAGGTERTARLMGLIIHKNQVGL